MAVYVVVIPRNHTVTHRGFLVPMQACMLHGSMDLVTFKVLICTWFIINEHLIMAYVERITGIFGGIIGRNAKNCRIDRQKLAY